MNEAPPTTDGNNTTPPANSISLLGGLTMVGIVLCIGALVTHLTAPPQMVTSVLLNEKSAMTSSLGGLQLGERLAEGGVFDLYLVLEFHPGEEAQSHQTETIEVAQLGNGVTFDVPDDLIEYRQLKRITVFDEDLFSDDIYDSIDVTLDEPFVGSVYQFRVNRTHPRQIAITSLLWIGIASLILSLILYFRQLAR